jgi:hypothetical protein
MESPWYLKVGHDSRCRLLGAHGVARGLPRSVRGARSELRRRGLVGIYTVGRMIRDAEVVKRDCIQKSGGRGAFCARDMANGECGGGSIPSANVTIFLVDHLIYRARIAKDF